MEIWFLTPASATQHDVGDLPALLERQDGFVWVDIPQTDDAAADVLSGVFGFHDVAVRLCRERNHLPASHAYRDTVFTVLHAPEQGAAGHVHLLELDQFVGARHLVTVHGPVNPDVPLSRALEDTQGVLARLLAGRLRPQSPAELSHAIISALVRRQQAFVTAVAAKVATLEQRVMVDDFRSPETLLDEMFLVRHELITVRTMAAQSHDVYARLAGLSRFVREQDRPTLQDVADQFDRLRSLADGEKEFLFGVIDLYQTRVATKMTVAVERLAVLAAVTLPITALASIYGMNVIVNTQTHVPQLLIVLAVMIAMSGTLLRWTKRQGWW
jgi:magnesium transporter